MSQFAAPQSPGIVGDLAFDVFGGLAMAELGSLMHCVITREDAPRKTFGLGSFDYFKVNTEVDTVFDRAMAGLSATVAPAIAEACDFSGVETVVELAGGRGLLLSRHAQTQPADARCSLLFTGDNLEEIARGQLHSVPEGNAPTPPRQKSSTLQMMVM